jgi:hypothetical protein
MRRKPLIVVGSIIALVACALWLLFGLRIGSGAHAVRLFVQFDEAPGVVQGTSVYRHGLVIGTVTDVQLAEDGRVWVNLRINEFERLHRGEQCVLVPFKGTQATYLEFKPGEPIKPESLLLDLDDIRGTVSHEPR